MSIMTNERALDLLQACLDAYVDGISDYEMLENVRLRNLNTTKAELGTLQELIEMHELTVKVGEDYE